MADRKTLCDLLNEIIQVAGSFNQKSLTDACLRLNRITELASEARKEVRDA